MIFAMAMGILSAFVVLIVMARIGLKKFMGYPAFMDAGVTVLLAWLLHGSYVGMVAAIIGGLVFSGMITVIRRMYGYSKLERRGLKLVWVDHYSPAYTHTMDTFKQMGKGNTTACLNLKSSKLLIASIAVLFVLASVL
jgi:hypothetical protein